MNHYVYKCPVLIIVCALCNYYNNVDSILILKIQFNVMMKGRFLNITIHISLFISRLGIGTYFIFHLV